MALTKSVIDLLEYPIDRLLDARRMFYRRFPLSTAIGVPVISVGALTMGGSGKTPITQFLARYLLRKNLRVAIVLRGYGSTCHDVIPVDKFSSVSDVGDEALFHRHKSTDIVIKGRDKVKAARLARQKGADVILVDDGLQHLRLTRELDIVLLEGAKKRLFPLGMGRETYHSVNKNLSQQERILWHHQRSPKEPNVIIEEADIHSFLNPRSFVDSKLFSHPLDIFKDSSVMLVSGIALPDAFMEHIKALKLNIIAYQRLGDHQIWPKRILRTFHEIKADYLITTEKDLFRHLDISFDRLYALEFDVVIKSGQSLLAHRLERLFT